MTAPSHRASIRTASEKTSRQGGRRARRARCSARAPRVEKERSRRAFASETALVAVRGRRPNRNKRALLVRAGGGSVRVAARPPSSVLLSKLRRRRGTRAHEPRNQKERTYVAVLAEHGTRLPRCPGAIRYVAREPCSKNPPTVPTAHIQLCSIRPAPSKPYACVTFQISTLVVKMLLLRRRGEGPTPRARIPSGFGTAFLRGRQFTWMERRFQTVDVATAQRRRRRTRPAPSPSKHGDVRNPDLRRSGVCHRNAAGGLSHATSGFPSGVSLPLPSVAPRPPVRTWSGATSRGCLQRRARGTGCARIR